MKAKHVILYLLLAIVSSSCIREEALNAEADILSCILPGVAMTTSPIINNNSITIFVGPGTDISELTPEFTLTPGATISPLSGTERNFNTPQEYTVTAADGVWKKTYIVSVIDTELATNYNFEDTLGGKKYYIFVEREGDKVVMEWASGNAGYAMTGVAKTADDYPTFQTIVSKHPLWSLTKDGFLSYRYATWSSRSLIEFDVGILVSVPAEIWRMVDSVIFVAIAVLLSKLLVNDDEKSFFYNCLACFFVGLFIISFSKILESAGWLATTTNYIWPICFILLHFYLLKEYVFKNAIEALKQEENTEIGTKFLISRNLYWRYAIDQASKALNYDGVVFVGSEAGTRGIRIDKNGAISMNPLKKGRFIPKNDPNYERKVLNEILNTMNGKEFPVKVFYGELADVMSQDMTRKSLRESTLMFKKNEALGVLGLSNIPSVDKIGEMVNHLDDYNDDEKKAIYAIMRMRVCRDYKIEDIQAYKMSKQEKLEYKQMHEQYIKQFAKGYTYSREEATNER